jgi:hypothetical protein
MSAHRLEDAPGPTLLGFDPPKRGVGGWSGIAHGFLHHRSSILPARMDLMVLDDQTGPDVVAPRRD